MESILTLTNMIATANLDAKSRSLFLVITSVIESHQRILERHEELLSQMTKLAQIVEEHNNHIIVAEEAMQDIGVILNALMGEQ